VNPPARAAVILLAAVVALTGCRARPGPIDPATAPDPQILPIAASFERTVARLHADPELDWHAGWTGNLAVNLGGPDNRGLCHEWRDAVYAGVLFDVRAQGWTARGITVNHGRAAEHHAVLVHDPALPPAGLLKETPQTGAYVLDAWRRGRADVFRLADWLTLPLHIEVPPALTDVDAEMRAVQRRGR
jgi:hypothetical protein